MIPNNLDKIISHILEPTKKASRELSKISHEQKSKSLKEKISDEYNREIENIVSKFKLSIDDLPLEPILYDLLWYCRTKFDVKCSDKKIDIEYKTHRVSGYLSPNELPYYLAFLIIENRRLDLFEQAYSEDRKVKDPKAKEMLKKYDTFLQYTSQFNILRELLYHQIGKLVIETLSKEGILEKTQEEYIIITEHPEVQKVIIKYDKILKNY